MKTIPCLGVIISVFASAISWAVPPSFDLTSVSLPATTGPQILISHGDRDALSVTVSYTENRVGSNPSVQLRLTVLDEDGELVPMVNPDNPDGDSITVRSVLVVNKGSGAETKELSVTPAEVLSSNKRYFVRAQTFYEDPQDSGNWSFFDVVETDLTGILHFTSTISGDASENILTYVDDVTILQDYALDTGEDDVDTKFWATVDLDLYRYDDFDAPVSDRDYSFRLKIYLYDDTGADIPLEDGCDVYEFQKTLSSHVTSDPKEEPDHRSKTVQVWFRPDGQLASDTGRYRLKAVLRHVKDPDAAKEVHVYANGTSETQRLFHFNGTLQFSTIFHPCRTTMVDFGGASLMDLQNIIRDGVDLNIGGILGGPVGFG